MTDRSPPPIEPVRDASARPLWSVMIPTYECGDLLRRTLESVLAQDPGRERMQVEVVDDASPTGDPGAVVAEVGGGRVEFFRQPENLGHVGNFNTCLRRSRGRLVHLLHGDDWVRPGFYDALGHAFETRPDIGAAFCRDIRADEASNWRSIARPLRERSGVLSGWLDTIAAGQRLQAPAVVVRREVYERLGGFDPRIRGYGEDWEMWVRIASRYPVFYEVEPLAVYRIRRDSLSGRSVPSGAHADDMRRVIELNREHLPPDRADALSRAAARNFALACLRRGHRFLKGGRRRAALVQIREALRTKVSVAVLLRACGLALLATLPERWLRTRPRGPA